MCHHLPVNLSVEDKKAVRRLTGMLMPAYAVVALAVIAALAIAQAPRPGELVASSAVTATARR